MRIEYQRMMPFLASGAGGSQLNHKDSEDIASTSTFNGGEAGAVKEKASNFYCSVEVKSANLFLARRIFDPIH